MKKINELPVATNAGPSDKFVLETNTGTKSVTRTNIEKNIVLIQDDEPTGEAKSENKFWIKDTHKSIELAEESEIVSLADNQTRVITPSAVNEGTGASGTCKEYTDKRKWTTSFISTENLVELSIIKHVAATYLLSYDENKTFISRTQIVNSIAVAETKTNIVSIIEPTWKYVRYYAYLDNETTEEAFLNDVNVVYKTNLFDLTHFRYKTVADMKADNIPVGFVVETLGYYSAGDGGGANYIISAETTSNRLTVNLDNGLYANMLFTDTIDIRQLGFVADDSTQNISPAFKIINDLSESTGHPLTLFFPYGKWYTTPYNFTCHTGVHLIGDVANCYVGEGYNSVLCTYNDSQLCIIRIGNDIPYTPTDEGDVRTRELVSGSDMCKGYYIDGLAFTGNVNAAAIVMVGVAYSKIGDIEFRKIDIGKCLSLSGCYEMNFGAIYFRSIYSYQPCLYFDNIPKTDTSKWSINSSANYFEYLSFEGFNGDAIGTSDYAFATDLEIGVIDFEHRITPNKAGDTESKAYSSREAAEADGATSFTYHYIFNGYFDNATVGMVNAYITKNIFKKDGTQSTPKFHMFKALFSDSIPVKHSPTNINALRNMMSVATVSVKCIGEVNDEFYIAYSKNTDRGALSSLTIGTLSTYEHNHHIYDSYNGMVLKIGTINGKMYNSLNTLMDKLYVNPRRSGYGSITLLTLDDAVDVSGCVLKVNNDVFPALCVNGITDLALWVKVARATTNAIESEQECDIIVTPLDDFSGNETRPNNPYTFHYTSGVQKIVINDLDFANEKYLKIRNTAETSMTFVMIYRIEYL